MSLSFLLIILIIGVAAYFLMKKNGSGRLSLGGKIPWYGYAIGAVLLFFLFPKIGNAIGANTYTQVDAAQVNSCGCPPGHLTVVRFKPFGRKARTQNMTCTAALDLQSRKPKRTSFTGCTTNV